MFELWWFRFQVVVCWLVYEFMSIRLSVPLRLCQNPGDQVSQFFAVARLTRVFHKHGPTLFSSFFSGRNTWQPLQVQNNQHMVFLATTSSTKQAMVTSWAQLESLLLSFINTGRHCSPLFFFWQEHLATTSVQNKQWWHHEHNLRHYCLVQ
jgi:hypothetical protein